VRTVRKALSGIWDPSGGWILSIDMSSQPLVSLSNQTTTESIMLHCFHYGPSKHPVLNALARTRLTEYLLISNDLAQSELSIFVLCPARAA
jgi:hypothetical protein